MSPGREPKDFSRELKGPNYCSSVNSSSDESTEGQNLQSVLVTVRIQRKPKPKNVKRVRFNSLVEVRFIPKVKRQDGQKCFQGKDCRDDKKKRKHRKEEQKSAKAVIKGAQENSKEVVAKETKNKLCLENNIKESSHDEKNFTDESDEDAKRIKDIKDVTIKSDCKNSDNADVQPKDIEVNVTDELGAERDEREEVSEISIKVSYATTRKVFTPPKVVVGENYMGLALKPVFPRVSACRTSYRSYRQTMKQSKLQDLNIMSLNDFNKHATSLCKEADTFLTECDDHNGEQSCESTAGGTQTPTIQPLIPIHKDQEGYMNMSDQDYTCQSPSHAYNQHDSARITKLYTNLPVLNKKGVAYSPLKSDSYCRLYLPHLQRKCEEINRLNDAILRRNPRYTRGITETNRYIRPRTTIPMPKYGKFGKLNRPHSPTAKVSEHNNPAPKSVLKYRYSSESVQLTKRRDSSNMYS